MRIAFIGGRNIHTIGGIENYMFHLATELAKSGYEPIVYCESDHNGTERLNGFLVIHQKSVGGRFLCKILLAYRASVRSLRGRYRADIFHYNAWPPSLASWLPRLFGRVTLLQGHGLEWKRTKYTPCQQRIMRFMERFTAGMNNHLIMVSQEQTDYFLARYGKQCTTIPTATTLPTKPVLSDVLERFGVAPKEYFLYLGRLVQDKNPDYLIRAFIRSEIKDKKLVIAGSNDAMPGYVAYLHELAHGSDNIVFTGAVYGSDKEKLLEACYAFCIPSTIEGLAITLLEAMSHGKACIASDIPSNREALGKNGIWCPYEDVAGLAERMVYACEHPAKLLRQGEANRQRVREYFTWERVVGKYIRYLEQIRKHE